MIARGEGESRYVSLRALARSSPPPAAIDGAEPEPWETNAVSTIGPCDFGHTGGKVVFLPAGLFRYKGVGRAVRRRSRRPMLEKLRNIGIIAHVDAGKTTTTERILYFSGSKHKVGDVDDGNTTTDFDPLEKAEGHHHQQRRRHHRLGRHAHHHHRHPRPRRFHGRGRALPARPRRRPSASSAPSAASKCSPKRSGIQANKHNVPRIAYINKLDRMGADFFDCIEQMKEKLGVIPAICAIPAGQSSEFEGVIDLIEMKFILKDPTDKTNVKYTLVDIPA